jgi:hypothetical protein
MTTEGDEAGFLSDGASMWRGFLKSLPDEM